MLSREQVRSLGWVALGVVVLLALAWVDVSSLHHIDSVSSIHALPLPAEVEFSATIRSVRLSGAALVMDLEDRGRISCYWRKPPALHFFFPHDRVRVRAKIEQTPKGKFCGVRELVPIRD
jgi:hypothetical protein